MPKYKLIYNDINYQNRKIVSLTMINDDGSADVIRATAKGVDHGCSPLRQLSLGSYPANEERTIEYVKEQAYYDEAFIIPADGKSHEKSFIIDKNSMDKQLYDQIMNFVEIEYFPYPIILKRRFLDVYVDNRTGLNGICDYCEITHPTPKQIQVIDAIFAAARFNKLLNPATKEVYNTTPARLSSSKDVLLPAPPVLTDENLSADMDSTNVTKLVS